MTIEQDITKFMEAIGQLKPVDKADEKNLAEFRISLIDEEYDDLVQAIHWGDKKFIAKKAADLVYVVVGTCVALGIPFDAVFDAVHASNMTKLDDEGKPYLNAQGKALKGPNYVAPEPIIDKLVQNHAGR